MASNFTLRSMIICDDLRREDNGKDIIIGVYNDDLVFGSFPGAVSALFFRVAFVTPLTGEQEFTFLITSADNKNLVDIKNGKFKPHDRPGRQTVLNIGVGNPITSPTTNSNGLLTGGFGFMNVNNIVAGTARNMLVVARLAF